MKPRFISILIPTLFCAASVQAAFRHPGLLHSRQDLQRMREMVAEGEEPWKSGFEVFRAHPQSQATYAMRGPLEMVGRNPAVGQGAYDQDAGAAYQCAIMWCITGDIAYAKKSKEILNAWSSTLKSITGRDAVLMAGLGPFKMVNAAEIIRHTDAGWAETDIRGTEQHFREVVYPVLKDFAPFANGNWDTAAIKTVMAIGVFCDDRAVFERGLRYYVNGAGNGCLTHYIINEDGQCQESGRDIQHPQLGLGHLGDCCEIAWNQGLDLYGYADNRLLKGFEYTAGYILGQDVPFTATLDRTGQYAHRRIASRRRGRLRPIFEQIYNHYGNRIGLATPFTQQAAERIRPERAGPGADHAGFGTLLFSRPATASDPQSLSPSAPAGVIARGTSGQISLTWVASVGAASYAVKRATTAGGRYAPVARDIKSPTWTDTTVTSGQVYRYVVSASNAAGESEDALEVSACAGLPQRWTQRDVGSVAVAGSTALDGSTYTVEGAGNDIGGTSDQFQFAWAPMAGDGVIVARFVPQVNSQSSAMGLLMRETPDANSAHVSLLLTAGFGRDARSADWRAYLVARTAAGADTSVAAGTGLSSPYVTWGRLTGSCWLRLEREGDVFAGSISPDGRTWMRVGRTAVALRDGLLVGLCACSRLTAVTTTVMFDHVAISGSRIGLQ
jgi:hypothetical protein